QSVKRELAIELGVDPYSTNQVLQKELESIAWASVSGATTIKVLMLPLGGGVVTAAKVASTGSEMQQILKESSPADLRKSGSEKLAAMGVPKAAIESFFANPAISPSHETMLVASLGRLDGVKGRAELVSAAA